MFGDRLKLARSKAGLSLRDLASNAGEIVSPQAIGKYERGEMNPSSQVLLRLASALEVPTSFLMSSSTITLGDLEFRKRAASTVRDSSAVKALVLDNLERYIEIESILGLPQRDWLSDLSGLGYTDDRGRICVRGVPEAERAARDLRHRWSLGFDPIPSMTELLEENGVKVLLLDMPGTVDGVTCVAHRDDAPPVYSIACSLSGSIERRRLTLAHELGHTLMDFVDDDVDKEKACHRFAAAFLAPAEAVRSMLGEMRHRLTYREIVEVKRFFGISAAALIYRLHDLDIISHAIMVQIFRTLGSSWRRVEPDPIDATGDIETPKRFVRLCLRAIAEGLITLSKGTELLRLSPLEIRHMVTGNA